MKSYIFNNIRVDKDLESTLARTQLFTKAYRNMIDETSFKSVNYDFGGDTGTCSNITNFPNSNILLDTNTKEVRFSALPITSSPGFYSCCFAIEINKEDTEGYDSLIIKMNKLNQELVDAMTYTDSFIEVEFSDTADNFTGEWDCPSFTSHPSPLSFKNMSSNTYTINKENMIFAITPEYTKSAGFVDRSGNPTDKIYHRFIYIKFTSTLDYMSISNITATNAFEVEFENNVDVKFKNLTKEQKSNQGILFKDVYNTVKEASFNLPLLDLEEYFNLEKNMFKKNYNTSFFIMPLSSYASGSGAISNYEPFENFNFGGHYFMEGDYNPTRKDYDIYEVKFRCNEVI